jgi:hypothetical protein
MFPLQAGLLLNRVALSYVSLSAMPAAKVRVRNQMKSHFSTASPTNAVCHPFLHVLLLVLYADTYTSEVRLGILGDCDAVPSRLYSTGKLQHTNRYVATSTGRRIALLSFSATQHPTP